MNNIIILDLEATMFLDSKGIQHHNYIIEIGAVTVSSNLEIIDKFHSYVKPEEEVSDFIKNLTGISNSDLKSKPTFDIVVKDFHNYIQKHGGFDNVILGIWGAYFDINLLKSVYERYNIEYPNFKCIDIKTVAIFWASLNDFRSDYLDIEFIAHKMNIKIDGRLHSAIIDAEIEALIYINCCKYLNSLKV